MKSKNDGEDVLETSMAKLGNQMVRNMGHERQLSSCN